MLHRILARVPPRWRRWIGWLGIAFIAYTLIGFFLLPPIIKWQMEKQLPGITKRTAQVRQVKVNPWTLSLTIRGLSLDEPDGRAFASWEELYVNFQASSLFRWAWTFKEIRLVKPFGEVILFKDGRLNFTNMLESDTKTSAPTAVPRVNIFWLEVTNGFVALEDRTRKSVFHTEYRPINVHLQNFTTRPDLDTPYSFRAESDAGRSVTWAGDLTVQPLRSFGHLELTAIQIPRYQPYLEDFTLARITNGLVDVQLDYRFAAGTDGIDLVVTNAAAQVSQVQAMDPDTGETVLGLKGVDVKGAGFNLRQNTARVGSVTVSEASLLARLKQNGELNLLSLITLPTPGTNTAKAASPLPPPTAFVDDLTIDRASMVFEDLTLKTPFKTQLKPIEVKVQGFTTLGNSNATYSVSAASETAETFGGSGSFSINPVRSVGELQAGGVEIGKYLPYVEAFFRGKVISGKITARVPYSVALAGGNFDGSLTNANISLTNLNLQLPETPETITHVTEIAVSGVDGSLSQKSARIGTFKGDGGAITVRRNKDGSINLLGLLAVSRTNTPSETAPVSADNQGGVALGGWTLGVDDIQLRDYSVKIEDLVPEKPATVLLDEARLSLKGASTVSNAVVTADARFRVNETGLFAAQGTASLAPLFADVELSVTNLDLRLAQPYIDPFAALGIASGTLTTAGKARLQTNDTATPQLTFSGMVQVTNLLTTDQVVFKEFVRWDDLSVSGIEAALLPTRLQIGEVRLVRPKASLLIGADRRPNLSLIMRSDTAATNNTKASSFSNTQTNTSLSQIPPVQLNTLTLDHASLAFTDESIQPPVSMAVEELSGSIKNLSSTLKDPAEVDLKGKMDAQSSFAIAGRVKPFPPNLFVDLSITNSNTQLTPLTGYMEKYGGYPLRKGSVSTSLRYHIEGMALDSQNLILVDHFTLGAANNSPDATKLPLKLGIALLKDNNGRIELDVPVKGTLDDPEFSIMPVVLKVVMNLIVKAAASPFKLLGALVGGGGDELSYVDFQPGSASLLNSETNKLAKLASALSKRPALNVEIEGAVGPGPDRSALARQKLDEQLKAKRLQELTAKGRPPEAAATFQIEPEERQRLLRETFVEQFGTNISAIIQTNLARLTATNQPAATMSTKKKRNLLQKAAGLFGAGSTRSKTERHLTKADREALGLATSDFMEELLAERTEITPEEMRGLMTARARQVQDWLVQQGQIAADRVVLVAPKPVDANYQGEPRASLSLN